MRLFFVFIAWLLLFSVLLGALVFVDYSLFEKEFWEIYKPFFLASILFSFIATAIQDWIIDYKVYKKTKNESISKESKSAVKHEIARNELHFSKVLKRVLIGGLIIPLPFAMWAVGGGYGSFTVYIYTITAMLVVLLLPTIYFVNKTIKKGARRNWKTYGLINFTYMIPFVYLGALFVAFEFALFQIAYFFALFTLLSFYEWHRINIISSDSNIVKKLIHLANYSLLILMSASIMVIPFTMWYFLNFFQIVKLLLVFSAPPVFYLLIKTLLIRHVQIKR